MPLNRQAHPAPAFTGSNATGLSWLHPHPTRRGGETDLSQSSVLGHT